MRLAPLATLATLAAWTSSARADAPTYPGTITGTVLFEGEPPERAPEPRGKDPVCAKTPGLAEDVVVAKGKLAGVLVRVKNGTAGTHAAPTAPATLDQHGCTYAPHVLGVMAGQTLRVHNDDGTFHNVRGTIQPGDRAAWNKPHPARAADLALPTSTQAGDVIAVACDVHPWMHAYVVVQDHPYFAVTDAEGKFALANLPTGTYTLEAWHPILGTKTLTVKLGNGRLGQVAARFSYKEREDLPASLRKAE